MSDVPGRETVEEEFDPAEIVDENEPPEELEGEEEIDEAEPEPEEGEEPEPVAAQPRGRKTQGERWRERYGRLESEVADLRTQLQTRQQPAAPAIDPAAQARAEAEKWERRAMMSPVELAQEMQREFEQQMRQQTMVQQFTSQDLVDKQTYDSKIATDQRFAKYQQRVDALLAQERARGNFGATRVALLKYLIGEDALSRPAPTQQRRAAASRVEGQRTRPVGARGDAPRSGRRPAAGSLEADLELVNAAIARGESVF